MILRSGRSIQSIIFHEENPEALEPQSSLPNRTEIYRQTQLVMFYNAPTSRSESKNQVASSTALDRRVSFKNTKKSNKMNTIQWVIYPLVFILTLFRFSSENGHRRTKCKPKRSFFTWFVHIFNTTAIILMLYRYFVLVNVDEYKDLKKHGLDNGIKATFSTDVYNWYVAPEKLKGLPTHLVLNSGLPIVMYIRGDREADSHTFHRINMLKNLALNGFNVVAPLSTTEPDLVKVWTRLQMRSEPTNIYLWFDHTSIDRAQRLANVLSETVSPPVAAIVERKAQYDFPDMAVWSTIFSALNTNKVGQINFLKCPVTPSFPGKENYQEIQTCFGTVNGNINFH